jgi:AraC-like DNA-binding protein
MRVTILEELLTTLDVRLHAFAVCEIQEGQAVRFDAMQAVVVHHVLAGRGVLHQHGDLPVEFGPRSIVVVAPGRAQSLSAGATDGSAPLGSGMLLSDGLLKFDAHHGGGELVTVCATITATHGGGFGLFDHQTAPIVGDVSDAPEFNAAFDLLLAEVKAPRMGTRALTEGLMKQCLIMLLRRQLVRSEAHTPLLRALREPGLARSIAAVLAGPGAAHTLESLAREASMSRSVFAERFYVVYGQTPFAFVQTTRLRNAARLLIVSDMPVKAIAHSVGYASRSHFSRAFRSAFGQDPSGYRNARAANDELDQPMVRPVVEAA